MRYVWITFVSLVLLLIGVFSWSQQTPTPDSTTSPELTVHRTAWVTSHRETPLSDSVVRFALQQLGTSYCYAGTSPETGFDCSGFVQYVFQNFHVPVPHSTSLLMGVGKAVPREQARRGDIVVFTGTAALAATPGHAGIVVSGPGEPIRFVHSSSARREPGVKISQVEGTDYERRFMGVRRVL